MLTTLVIYLLIGALAGLLAGLLGIGGGLFIVPCLAILFPYEGIAPEYVMHMAICTTLMITIFTSLSALRTHIQKGGVLFPVFKKMLLGLLIGASLGALIAGFLPSHSLKIIFSVFAFLIALQMGLNFKPKPTRQLPGKVGLFSASGILSFISSIVGLSGGVLVVPYFTSCNIPMKNAVSTSAACTLPIALAGGLSLMVTGFGQVDLPAWSFGYIYLPAFFAVALMSVIFAPLGARLAHSTSPLVLKRFFAIFLVVIGFNMLFFG
jgi:uncharacterized membrane protein YfcA